MPLRPESRVPGRTHGTLDTAPRWLVAVAVILATVMVILDMTIVNVALPHMMGALGARADQITWVLTAYIVMEAVCIPLTGYLSALLGRRSSDVDQHRRLRYRLCTLRAGGVAR